MKIIHTGDFHLDSALRTHLTTEIANKRKKELFEAFKRVIDYANSNNIKVIILAGDIFDTGNVKSGTKKDFLKLIEKNPDIDFIYALGNHDENTFDIEANEAPANLYMANDFWSEKVYDDIKISYINFNDNSEKILYDTLNLNKEDKNIVVLHGEVTEHNDKGKIQLKRLTDKNINYLALGHIHMNSVDKLDDNGVYAYCGCLEGRGFDEEGEKGFYVIDTDDIKNPTFVVNSKRIIHKLEVSIDDITHWFDYKERVEKAIENIPSEDMVEIIITGRFEMEVIKKPEDLAEWLNERFFFAKVKDKSRLKINVKDYENTATFKGQFIKKVMNSTEYSETEKEEIIEIGIHALEGEEF